MTCPASQQTSCQQLPPPSSSPSASSSLSSLSPSSSLSSWFWSPSEPPSTSLSSFQPSSSLSSLSFSPSLSRSSSSCRRPCGKLHFLLPIVEAVIVKYNLQRLPRTAMGTGETKKYVRIRSRSTVPFLKRRSQNFEREGAKL